MQDFISMLVDISVGIVVTHDLLEKQQGLQG